MEVLVEYLGKGFMIMLTISLPCVLMAALVGLVVGILQAVTSVQEQTIAAAPKIVLVFLTIVVLGGYFIKILTNFVFEGVHIAFQIVPKQDSYVLPSDYYQYTRPFDAEYKQGTGRVSDNKLKGQTEIQWDKKATKHSVYVKSKQTSVDGPNFLERVKIQNNR